MEAHLTLEGVLISLTNIGVVLATGVSVWLTLKESHRHDEVMAHDITNGDH